MKYLLLIALLVGCGNPMALNKSYDSLQLPEADQLDFSQYSQKADLFISYWWPTPKYHKNLGLKQDYQTWINGLTYEVVLRGNQLKEATRSKYLFEKKWSKKESCLNCECHLYYDCPEDLEPDESIADQCFDIELEKLDFIEENFTLQATLLSEMEALLDPTGKSVNWITTASTYSELALHLFPTINFETHEINIPLLGLSGNKEISYKTGNGIEEIKLNMLLSGAELTFNYIPPDRNNQLVKVELSLSKSIGKLLAFGETFLYENGIQVNRGLMILEFPENSAVKVDCD